MIILITGNDSKKKEGFSETLSELVLARYISETNSKDSVTDPSRRSTTDLVRLILMSGEDVVLNTEDDLVTAFPKYWNLSRKLNIPLKVLSLSFQYGSSYFEKAAIPKSSFYLKLDPRTLSIDDMLEVTLKHLNNFTKTTAVLQSY